MRTVNFFRRMKLPNAGVETVFWGLLLILAVIALGIWLFRQEARTLAAQQRQRHADAIIQSADSILIGLQNIETGQRGYLITGNISYLEPYHRGTVSIDQRILRLGRLLPATPANATLIATMRTLAARKIAEIDQTIRVRTKHGFSAAANIVRTNVGKQVMDMLRAELSSIRNHYQRVALYERVLVESRLRVAQTVAGGFSVALLVTLLGMYWRIVHVVRRSKKMTDHLVHNAHNDPLTDLPNRGMFMNWLTYGLAQAQRMDGKAAVLFLDLDGFKPVNDRLGHSAGDHVLCEVAQRFKQSARTGDMIARIGGDEFAVFIPAVSNESDPAELAHRLIEAMRQPIVADGSVVYVGVSIGAAMYPRNGKSPEALLEAADQAMYRAKREGGRKLAFHNSALTDQITREARLRGGLQHALQAKEFEFHYQPLLDAQTLKPVAVEALLRWRHPELGLLVPGEFLPVAERSGFMRKLGPVLLQNAGEQMAVWRRQGLHLRLAFNISPFQCSDQNLISAVESMLLSSGMEPQNLYLEITESGLLQADARPILRNIRQLGVGLTLDDFVGGSGGLACLRQLLINQVKFDRRFITGLTRSPADMDLLSGLTDLTHRLGMQVAAGGVETQDQDVVVRRLGCDLVQGNLYAGACSPEDVTHLLHQWKAA